jgi:asparagine synthase (glutamine-hydrolysing)
LGYTGIKSSRFNLFWAFTLSILDLDVRSSTTQFEDFTIVFNGEIYNFEEIKKELLTLGYSLETTGDKFFIEGDMGMG